MRLTGYRTGKDKEQRLAKRRRVLDSIDYRISKKHKEEQDEERKKAKLEDFDESSVLDDEVYPHADNYSDQY
ncbi:hypothetical protein BDZ45DRAFT_745723 [Acephala macrosclerotiorum]|nr:hypothetical protein BDZ45DRAFT_745723 [Acephala macrosclerotiorum]